VEVEEHRGNLTDARRPALGALTAADGGREDGAMHDTTLPSAEALRAAVDHAMHSRRSVRAFLPKPVPRALVEEILAVASRAPSGTNIQPWKVHVVTGAAKERLTADILRAHEDPAAAATHAEEYDYYPSKWVAPYLDRRRKVGFDLYALLGIEKRDIPRMRAQHGRNYAFFGAPVGLFFTLDRSLGRGSLLDYGMFLQSVMLAARARGLDTCAQASFTQFHRIVRAHLEIPESELLVCGMSLGHADPSRPENGLRTEREPVGGFTCFHE
jgi:nitroreductase